MHRPSRAFVSVVAVACVAAATSCRHAAPAGAAAPAARAVERLTWSGDVAHYRFDVPLGPGPFDAVRVHRVVRETAPGRPIAAKAAVFLLPGSPNWFEPVFLPPSITRAVGREHALAAYLASRGVDVWGMDYAWALVPAATADLSFMREWGVERDVRDTARALAFARSVRSGGGGPSGPLHVLGFSYGGIVGYALAGVETQREAATRDVRGLIVLDIGVGLMPGSARDAYCRIAAADASTLATGTYSDDSGVFLGQLADAALAAPAEPSPALKGFTNAQAALVCGANVSLVNGQFWNVVGGVLDGRGVPTRLRFTDERLFLDLMKSIPPHFPARANLDVDTAFCGETAVPVLHAHLGEIALPILYVGAVNGFGAHGVETARRTASRDVTVTVVRRLPEGQERGDFAHGDVLLAADAPELVWRPVLEWIQARR